MEIDDDDARKYSLKVLVAKENTQMSKYTTYVSGRHKFTRKFPLTKKFISEIKGNLNYLKFEYS